MRALTRPFSRLFVPSSACSRYSLILSWSLHIGDPPTARGLSLLVLSSVPFRIDQQRQRYGPCHTDIEDTHPDPWSSRVDNRVRAIVKRRGRIRPMTRFRHRQPQIVSCPRRSAQEQQTKPSGETSAQPFSGLFVPSSACSRYSLILRWSLHIGDPPTARGLSLLALSSIPFCIDRQRQRHGPCHTDIEGTRRYAIGSKLG